MSWRSAIVLRQAQGERALFRPCLSDVSRARRMPPVSSAPGNALDRRGSGLSGIRHAGVGLGLLVALQPVAAFHRLIDVGTREVGWPRRGLLGFRSACGSLLAEWLDRLAGLLIDRIHRASRVRGWGSRRGVRTVSCSAWDSTSVRRSPAGRKRAPPIARQWRAVVAARAEPVERQVQGPGEPRWSMQAARVVRNARPGLGHPAKCIVDPRRHTRSVAPFIVRTMA